MARERSTGWREKNGKLEKSRERNGKRRNEGSGRKGMHGRRRKITEGWRGEGAAREGENC